MSIRWRMTAWFTAMLALTLLSFGIFLYWLMQLNFNAEVNRSLTLQATEVLRSIRIVAAPLRSQRVVLPDVDVFASPGIYLQVADTNGEVIARSSNMGRQSLPVSAVTVTAAAVKGEFFETRSVGHETLRLFNLPLILNNEAIGLLQVGRSLSSVTTALNRLRLVMSASSLLVLAVAAAIGWWLARKALRPIDNIAQAAEVIQEARDLERRIDYGGPPDEVGRLAGTFNGMLARLQAAYAGLEESYAAQRRFVADASHELRTPLTTIRGNVELLQKMGGRDPEEQREVLTDIAGEAERMSRLINGLLALARADAGYHITKEPVDVGEILREVARQARLLAGNVEFAAEYGELEGVLVTGNQDYLKQLVLILLDNAFKYSLPGGRVELGAGQAEGGAVITVRDNGIGIPAGDLQHIFERFYRGDKARRSGGTGLGLSIASWIVSEHGGRISVESAPDLGSIFKVWLPLAKESVL